ncbi:MAG: TonB-dependent receptor [Pseudomonadales bacterium]|nr:TonB-dependent receptor [Pseudomonadales bacterium]
MQHLHRRTSKKTLAWSITVISAALALPAPGFTAEAALEEITVTGSRIRLTDGRAEPTPVTALTPDELASFDPGATIAEQLDALPQFFATQSAQRGGLALSGDAGASFLNMRSLGTNRTLVLLDGARLAPADKRGPVNVDTLPTALVRTVDVVTGGASAAYGADALGGVTNFILDRDFQGLKASAGSGITEFGDGFRWNASIAGGKQFFDDRLSLIGSFETRFIEQIDRDPLDLNPEWFRRWGHVTNPAWVAAGCVANVYCEAGPQRLTLPNIAPTDAHVYGIISGTGTILDRMVFNREGTEVAPMILGDISSIGGNGTTNSTSGGPLAELANRAYSGPVSGAEVIGRSSFLSAKYDITDSLSAYVQLVAGVSESNNNSTRADTLGINLTGTWAPRIAIDNVYVPEFVRQTLQAAGRSEFILARNGAFLHEADMGIDQKDRNIFNSKTWTAGFDWELPNAWNLSGSYSTGKTERRSSVENMLRVDRMFLAMDAVRHPVTGNIVCRVQVFNPTVEQLREAGLASGMLNSVTRANPNPGPLQSPIGLDNTVRDCVPFNVMGFGNISQEAIDYIGTDKWSIGIVEQDFAETVLTGEVFDGWGYGPVAAAFGLTWRQSSFIDEGFPIDIDMLGPPLNAPELGIRGISPGYTGGSPYLHQFAAVPYVFGDYSVWEWFTEWQLPLWQSASEAQRISSSLAFRQSDYNLSGRSNSWKIGIDAQLIDGLRLRATQSRDVREASFSERFDSQGGGGNVRDPERGDVTTSITVVASGNPDLAPEVADTTVVGLVFQPTWAWLDGLSISTDWYSVDIAGSIQQIAAQDVVDRCFAGDTEQCDNIVRDPPVTGEIARVFRRFFNQDQATVKGVDIELAYRMEPDFFSDQDESINVRILGGYLLERKDINANGIVTDLTGPATLPDFTATLTSGYSLGPYSVQLQGRFTSAGKLNRTWEEGVQVDDNWLPSFTTWNGQLNYRGELDSGATWTTGLSVQNLFDRNPPIVPGGTTGAQGGLSGQYDEFGRRYNLSVNVNF